MSPKEKAIKLVDQFQKHVYCYMGSGMLTNDYDEKVALANKKACALICVEELLNAGNVLTSELLDGFEDVEFNNYWKEVKQEIQNL